MSKWLDSEIGAMRMLFNDGTYNGLTPGQRGKLFALFAEAGIKGEDMRSLRIEMLREWTGIEQLDSSNHLTFTTANKMIGYLVGGNDELSWDGAVFLAELEGRAKTSLMARQSETGMEDEAGVPNVLETYLPWLA